MILRFADCSLDTARHELIRAGQPVHVEPQVFHLLVVLAQADGDVVTKEALIEQVWRGLNVSDATISARINAARAAVGDDGKTQRIIRTIPKHGFQLVVPLDTDDPPATTNCVKPAVKFTGATDGAQIAHAHHGQGPPLMRASHWLSHLELDWDSPVWLPMLQRLGQNFTLFRYDQRGTGLSTREVDNLDIDVFADDLRAVADANGLVDRFPIFAASQAVPVAIRFAARYPERVSRMVLYGGYAVGRAFRDPQEDDVDLDTILSLIRAGWGRADSAFLQAFATLFMPDATPEQVRNFVAIQSASISAEGAARLRFAVDQFNVEADLDQVRAPVMVVHGRGDAVHPMSQGQFLAARLPNAEFVMLASRNHAPLPQDPAWDVLMQTITDFCQGDTA